MDLLKGPIREGSRGGRGEFKWSDVKDSKDREYYLGVSVKAPTGRWQQNRDIQWYSRAGETDQAARDRAAARAEEIKKIKEAENDALSAALGFAVAPRHADAGLSQGEVDRAIKEAGAGGDERDDEPNEKGIGFGRIGLHMHTGGGNTETMAGNAKDAGGDTVWRPAKLDKGGDGDRRRKRDDRDRRGEGKEDSSRRRHHRSRSRERHRRHRSRSRSKERERRHDGDRQRRNQSRSPRRSPARRHDERHNDKRDRNRDERRRRYD
ncbi:hypothetical protein DRE_02402 [Drechslerella stenobrocha 248]|uniref:Multiple myeloma tumor-associated protein 2-like N-terminal domain-containing protein n=1 Tax=Drechslerella stenobrocha 248 TaxID=1043628 RepID=W7I7K8_9PEZI|nr:hypothetical protein DRE_02402 [Drechslerella stenobrocha 248]